MHLALLNLCFLINLAFTCMTLHERSIFKDERTFSHGCIRLQEPFQFAYSLLRDQEVEPEEIQEVLEKEEETYKFI